jgi:hypothetical protein
VLSIPLGAIAGVALLYVGLALGGMSEREGRRGLTAGVFGLVPGGIGGFMAGFAGAQWIQSGSEAATRGLLAGIVTGVLLALVLGFAGLLVGIPLAESRGVTNYAGERAAWSLFYVALPTAALAGIGGFLLGRWLAG